MATLEEKIDQHINDADNPHRVSKDQIGLINVENYPLATPAQAKDGNDPELYVTPARLKDVFDGILTREGLLDENGNIIYQ